jgi:hypothetical protein
MRRCQQLLERKTWNDGSDELAGSFFHA